MITHILQFMYAKGAGENALRRLCSYVSCNLLEYANNSTFSLDFLMNNISLKKEVAQSIINSYSHAKEVAHQLEMNDIITIWIGHELYPSHLLQALGDSAPPVIFCKGNLELLAQKSVGFCGSRKASEKGLNITGRCAEQLVEKGICVVSGYAHGVDMFAHKAALEKGGTTIFVLVEGILRFQKKRNVAELLTEKNYLAVSQFPPLLSWVARNAMRRNATIIGLSEAMILVESGLSGGTFAAGEETLKRQQPLFVIDFAAPGPSAEANPYFIKKGGVAIRGNKEGKPNLSKLFDMLCSVGTIYSGKKKQECSTNDAVTAKTSMQDKRGSLFE